MAFVPTISQVLVAFGFDSRDGLIFGVGVMPRAGIELAVISVGRSMGIIDDQVFSAIVLMIAVSVLATPVLLKLATRGFGGNMLDVTCCTPIVYEPCWQVSGYAAGKPPDREEFGRLSGY